ncbi:FtsK/SpoIIIE family DNA translocase [Alkalitalea saponilacus]|uniref:DNA segregation ATPase FtsK/SpoIIIE, S-DNA-T family n=1 Tax=Alkalitalea saponilacus TaxID=889453 RepID=A0A1T5H297_9BACT|nr:DNA translocase FtsK [Alkalitalea saponilacus]ASB50919.1 cell division protein FtsK [Alkalitalea saponilacus]SKC14778.1 DNA segregation ATPase FtsK/SpoIIIE, S-DNA-T family [Alkalitalea saponilacus]
MASKSKKSRTANGKRRFKNPLASLKESFKNYKFRFATGLIIVAFSFYLAVAFFSFFNSGYADRSKFDLQFVDLIKDTSIQVDNVTGKIGAWFADLMVNKWFGLASFSFVFLLFITGFRLLGARVLPLSKTLIHASIITIWVSVSMGFFFMETMEDKYLLLGGAHGFHVSHWLISTIGHIGTFILILISLVIYLTINFEWFLIKFRKLIGKDLAIFKENDFVDTAMTASDSEADNNEQNNAAEADESITEAVSSVTTEETENEFQFDIKPAKKFEALPVEHPDNELELKIEKAASEEIIHTGENRPQGDYDPTLDLSSYIMPSFDLLDDHKSGQSQVTEEELIYNKNKIVKTLEDYKIQIKSIKATVGPTVTLYEIVPMPGVRISKIKNLEDDIALSLAALGIRIIAPIPGEGTIGIEVPNSEPQVVSMKSIITSRKFQNTKFELPVALGKTISNETFVFDLTKAPHLLVAGATGQGKSVGLNAIITSLLYKKHPSQLKFVLVDPKKVELNIYSKIERHFLAKLPDEEEPIITDVQRVVNTLHSLTIEMEDRYDLLKKAHTRNIKEYNHKFIKRELNPEKGHHFLPYIIVIIDEFADLIMTAGKEVELPIARIAQLARAVGIHMIIATQRPSTNIITGVIKANFPTRIAFKVASMIDSRTILDSPGANQLIGRGDMLISQGSDLIRVQCAFVDTPEVEKVNDFIGQQRGYPTAMHLPEYVGETGTQEPGEVDLSKRDPMFEEAARVVVANQSGSTSLIQRRFSIGYNRAGRIIDQLEAAGVVGPFEGSKARQVLVSDELELERMFEMLR